MRILIIEDDKKTAESICKGVAAAGFETVCAHDGEAGLAEAENSPVDLAVIDIMLPKLDGFEVIRRLREQKIMFPVIVLSAKSEEESKIRGLEAGADDYLAKPFSLAELIARINAQLRRANNNPPSGELEG